MNMTSMLQLAGLIQRASRLCCALLGLSLVVVSWAQDNKPSGSAALAREEAVLFSVTAKVGAIELEQREVTFKGPRGNCLTMRARDAKSLQGLRLRRQLDTCRDMRRNLGCFT